MTTMLPFADADRLVGFLRTLGVERVSHSKRTFLDHLVGTAALLHAWGMDDSICKAGLFHSIYGTEAFRNAILSFDERARVREIIGREAEQLAYLFCAFERSSAAGAAARGEPYFVTARASGEEMPVSKDALRGLICILWANQLEQAPHVSPSAAAKRRLRPQLAKTADFLPGLAMRDLEALVAPARGPDGGVLPEPGLSSLLNVDSAASFLEAYWPERLYLAKGPVERLAGLVDHDFDALCRMKKSYTKAFFRTLEGASTSIPVQPGQERPLYEAGFTIYFHHLASPPMAEWVSSLEETLGLVSGVTRIAAFASRRGQGLKPHYDQNDNFVCQARGTKRWRIWPNTHVKYPTAGFTVGGKVTPVHEVEAPDGFPAAMPEEHDVVDLVPGTVMFMPRGMWHDTQTTEDESLHFNIQSGLAMWRDAIEYVLTRTTALHREDLRAPLIGLFEGERSREGFGEELKAKLKEVIATLDEADFSLGRKQFFKFVTSRRPSA